MSRSPEHREQCLLFRWAALDALGCPELALLYAIPNGGHRNRVAAAKLKAEGVRRGVPDICLPVARSGCGSLYIEMKADYYRPVQGRKPKRVRGRPTKEQRWWIERLREAGQAAVVCWGWEEARDEILRYLRGGKDLRN